MQKRTRSTLAAAFVAMAVCAAGTALARELGTREAREAIASLLRIGRDDVRIKSLSGGVSGDDMVATAQVELSFQMRKQQDGTWAVAAVRFGDRGWEDVELLKKALDAEKAQRARSDLRLLASGLESFRRDRGFYPRAEDLRGVVDHISPKYLPEVVREDPWHEQYFFKPSNSGYVLGSAGPDRKPETADDIVVSQLEQPR